jgi:ACT domain-containing protein
MTRLPRVLLCLAALWLVVRPAAAQEKQYELSNFDVTVQVRPDGSYEVEETLTYDYQQGTFTYAYRVLDAEDVEAIRNVRVTSPNTTVDSVRRVGDDEGVRVRWTYPERSAPATFRIRYVVEGALFEQGDRNLMYRDVLDAGATVSTHDVDVRVALPAAFDLTPGAVSVDPDEEGTVQRSGGRIVAIFHRDQMNTGDEYPVEVSFPKRLPGQYSPTSGDLLLGLFLFLFGAGGGLALNLRWKGPRTEREAVRPPPDVSLSEGPFSLGPRLVLCSWPSCSTSPGAGTSRCSTTRRTSSWAPTRSCGSICTRRPGICRRSRPRSFSTSTATRRSAMP